MRHPPHHVLHVELESGHHSAFRPANPQFAGLWGWPPLWEQIAMAKRIRAKPLYAIKIVPKKAAPHPIQAIDEWNGGQGG